MSRHTAEQQQRMIFKAKEILMHMRSYVYSDQLCYIIIVSMRNVHVLCYLT
jgi:hypothetical protein